MRKSIFALLLLVITAGGFYYYTQYVYKDKPARVRELDESIRRENEKLIAAQIIANELKQVTRLIEGNLAQSQRDSLAEDASLPFMNQLTDILRDHDIDLEVIEPKTRKSYPTYVATPYLLEMNTSYKSLVRFLNDVEKSNRLVTLDKFELSSQVKQVQAIAKKEGLTTKRPMSIELSTLTLIKQK
ncbi:MAG: type 4a pilus biogenesis protein PilO [Calditrichaeota bacterium]|nr:type 4a pilus biogenesis protein PilO [Calditrichota bacterium]MCB9392009.1 type 4a pilus biogenesis protein PilO [Calditrichota bacterium]